MGGFAGGIVGGAVVRLFLDSSQFNQAWGAAEAKAKGSAQQMGGAYSKMGVAANAAFLMAQAALVTFVASGVKAALDFERAFQKITAISNASADEIAVWRDQLMQVSKDTTRPVNELADALYFLSSAGLDAAQVMPVLEASAQAATAGLGNTADIAKITAQALNTYAASGLTATQVVDSLVAAVRAGSADPEEFAGALGRILPAASAAKIGFDQVVGSLAALSNIGLDVNEGVTAMRGLLLALIAPGGKAGEAMAALGISSERMRQVLEEKGLIAALRLLEEATGGNLDKMKAVVPNVRALAGALGLTTQEASKVDEVFRQTLESTGSLSQAFGAAMAGPAQQISKSFNDLALAGLQIGEKLIPALVVLAKVVGVAADNFTALLSVLLLYKSTTFLPVLLQNIGLAMGQIGISGAAVALTQAAEGAVAFGAAVQTAMPWLLAITAGWLLFKSLTGEAEQKRLAATMNSGTEAVKAAAQSATKVRSEIDAAVAKYTAELVDPNEVAVRIRAGYDPLTQEQQRLVEEYRRSLEATAQSTLAAVDVASMSLEEFTTTSESNMKAVAQLAPLLGKSYSDMTQEIKSALSDTEDREGAWAELTQKYMLDAASAVDDWRSKTTDALSFVDDRFAELAGNGEASISKIVSELKKSLQAQITFNRNLETIAARAKQYGIDASSILQTFIDAGPAAADTVAAFAKAGEDSFRSVIDMQNESMRNGGKAARSLQDDVIGTLQDIRDILQDIARVFGVKVKVDVDDTELRRLAQQLGSLGIATKLLNLGVKGGIQRGLATGGVIAGASGFVTNGPTYLVGEGRYATRFGTGAELVQPLNEHTMRRLGEAIGQYTGGSTRVVNTTINVAGKVERPEDISRSISWWTRAQGL